MNIQIKKKALLVTEYYYPHWTGIAKTFSYVGQNVHQQGFDITILTTQFDKKKSLKRRTRWA
jgi:hypothetical protein